MQNPTQTQQPPKFAPSFGDVLGHHAANPPEPRQDGAPIYEMREEVDADGNPVVLAELDPATGKPIIDESTGLPKLRIDPDTGKPMVKLVPTGDVWRVSNEEAGIKAQFEGWVKDAGRLVVEGERNYGLDAYRTAQAQYLKDVAAGLYNWGGEIVLRSLAGWPGQTYFLFLLLRRCHPDITEEDAEGLKHDYSDQVNAAIGIAMGNWAARRKSGRLARISTSRATSKGGNGQGNGTPARNQ